MERRAIFGHFLTHLIAYRNCGSPGDEDCFARVNVDLAFSSEIWKGNSRIP